MIIHHFIAHLLPQRHWENRANKGRTYIAQFKLFIWSVAHCPTSDFLWEYMFVTFFTIMNSSNECLWMCSCAWIVHMHVCCCHRGEVGCDVSDLDADDEALLQSLAAEPHPSTPEHQLTLSHSAHESCVQGVITLLFQRISLILHYSSEVFVVYWLCRLFIGAVFLLKLSFLLKLLITYTLYICLI